MQQDPNRDWEEDFDHMEINIEMDELLGLRGDMSVLFRNVSWFLAFNGAYLGLFAFIPYTLGSTITSAVGKIAGILPFSRIVAELNDTSESSSLPAFFVKTLFDAIIHARENGDCLQLVDLCTCCVGYFSISFTIVLWRFMVTTASSYIHRPVMEGLLWALKCLTAIVKVSTLLIVKMVLLPIVLGFGIDFATLQLFQATPHQRITFCLENMVGSILIHWVMGITFMLFVTVSVLQLREVLHPDILSRKIRPQESHPDLLRTLLSERSIKHARRMMLSLIVYSALLVVLIHLPIRFTNAILPNQFPLVLRFQYFCPEIQVPLELLVVHLVVLGVLEHSKNQIGQFQHLGLAFLSEKLGLKECLLPRVELTPGEAIVLAPPPLYFHPQAMAPPQELRLPGHRYLPWPEDGVNGPQRMEFELLPRKFPKQVSLRLVALLIVGWLACVVSIASLLFGTLLVGRICTAPFERLTGISHEPLAMAAGVQIVWDMVNAVNTMLVLTIPTHQVDTSLLSRGYCVKNMSGLNATLAVLGWELVCPLLTGYFFSACFPSTNATRFEIFWVGYLVFNLVGWVICCLHRKNHRGRRRRHGHGHGHGRHEIEREVVEDSDEEEEDVGADEQERNMDGENNSTGDQMDDGIIAAYRKCHQTLVFNLTVHNDEELRQRTDNIRGKCFDLDYFLTRLLKPVLVILLTMILCPTVLAFLMAATSHNPAGSQHHFAPAAATMSCLTLLINSHKDVFQWMYRMRESVRNERYLIGRQLQDMAR